GAAGASSLSAPARERTPEPVAIAAGGGVQALAVPQPQPAAVQEIKSLADIEGALQACGHVRLASEVYQYVHLIKIEQGRLEIHPKEVARPELAHELGRVLTEITGTRWVVSVSGRQGMPTLAE